MRSSLPAGSRPRGRLSLQSSCCCTSCLWYPPSACNHNWAFQPLQGLAPACSWLQGADSFYAPYLATLPAGHNCVLGWREDEKAELKGGWLRLLTGACDQQARPCSALFHTGDQTHSVPQQAGSRLVQARR